MKSNYKKGIYQITSPSGKVYIGKSKNLHKRWITYINLHCKKQVRLYNSFVKYGVNVHKFEIIEECFESQLDKREAFHKRKFIKINNWDKALFCHINDGKGKKMSDETKLKIGKTHIGNTYTLGYKFTNEQKKRISNAKKGKKQSEKWKKNRSLATKGKPKPIGFSDSSKKTYFPI